MTNVWFTSDTHFGHENIIQYCGRPFGTTDLMDEYLIQMWNERVKPEDTVYHLGDVAMGQKKYWHEKLAQLQGTKFLIPGNHDPITFHQEMGIFEVLTGGPRTLKIEGLPRLIAGHFPMAAWDHQSQGAVHIHGHSHGSSVDSYHRIDVGVDCWDYKPISWEEIDARRRTLPVLEADSHHDKTAPRPDFRGRAPLILLIGPVAAGKSTLCKRMVEMGEIEPGEVINADAIRFEMFGRDYYPRDEHDPNPGRYNPADNHRVFEAVRSLATTRLSLGLRVILDETFLNSPHRRRALTMVTKDTPVEYWVVNRPLADKLRDGGWRLRVPGLIEKYDGDFHQARDLILRGDDRPNVTVRDFTNGS